VEPIGRNRFAIAFQTFIFTPAGPGGHVVVRAVATFTTRSLGMRGVPRLADSSPKDAAPWGELSSCALRD
jgi:hypothetical protein